MATCGSVLAVNKIRYRIYSALFSTGALLTILGFFGLIALVPATLEIGAFPVVFVWFGAGALVALLIGIVLMTLADKQLRVPS